MNDFILSLACFLATLALYFANKKLYRRRRTLLLMPLVLTPMILVLLLVVTHISYQDYIGETHWLLWLLGPATIAFAVPVYENLHHPPPLAVADRRGNDGGAGGGVQLGVAGAPADAAGRGAAQPGGAFDHHAVRAGGRQTDGRAAGSGGAVRGDHRGVRHGGGRHSVSAAGGAQPPGQGAGFGASSHGAGTARAYELGPQEGVVSSLVMMLAGIITVVAAPLIGRLMW